MKKNTKNLICLAVFGALLIRNFQLMKQRDFWKSKAYPNVTPEPMNPQSYELFTLLGLQVFE